MSDKQDLIEDLMKDEKQRTLKGTFYFIVFSISVIVGTFQILEMAVYPIDPWVLRALHFGAVMAIGLLTYSARKQSSKNNPSVFDIIMAGLIICSALYITLNYSEILGRVGVDPTRWDVFFGSIALVGLLEVTRRTTGWALPILAILFLVYAYFGSYMPGALWHKGYSIERIISYVFSMSGIYSIPLGVAATYVFLFILFGTFLEISGAGKFFIDLAYSLAGRFRGGPAKVAVLASALMGTVNGTSVANVATTGVFTIPLMKRVGYKSSFAGSVEAVASTGGQILPPVMGAGAFIMADITGIPYSSIIIAALIPAILYFLSVIMMVDLEAGKLGLKGMPQKELPSLTKILKKQGYLIVPLVVLLFSLVILQNSPVRAALWAIASLIVLSWFGKDKVFLKKFFKAISNSFKMMVQITSACASAGIIIGVFTLTGVGAQLARFIMQFSGGFIWIALICVMILCILLGMGLPTVAAYALAASTVAPPLVELGIPALTAHLFIFYFSCLSTITPPVALSAFAGAAIANAPPMKVAWSAVKLGTVAFIVPYLFVMNQGLLLQGNLGDIVLPVGTAILGIFILSSGLQGFVFNNMTLFARVVSILCATIAMLPIGYFSFLGIIAFLIILVFNKKGELGVKNMAA